MLKVKLLLLLLFYYINNIVCATNDCQNIKNEDCQIKTMQQRQKTRAGFVDDDASDVIHIIEPPQHFQQLKMIINQMDGQQYDILPNRTKTVTTTTRTIKPNYRKISTNRQYSRLNSAKIESDENLMKVRVKPTTITLTTTTVKSSTIKPASGKAKAKRIQQPTKHRRQPQQQQQQQKLSNIMRNMNSNNNSASNNNNNNKHHNANDLDLLTQEAHYTAMHLPMEILASVRKTQNIVHKQRAQLPVAAMQRLQTRRKHTVIMQQGYEHEKHERAQAQQLAAEKVHLLKKSRIKRQTNVNATQNAANVVQHISELLAHATQYLPNDNDDDDHDHNLTKNAAAEQPKTQQNARKFANELSAKWQEDNLPKALIGEIEPNAVYNRAGSDNAITADDAKLYEFLESSVNVTDAILNQLLQRQQQKSQNKKKILHCKRSLLPHNLPPQLHQRLRMLQDKMLCMQEQRIETSETKTKKYVTRALPTSTLAHARTRQNKQFLTKKRYEAAADSQTHALLYDDVMSNIRNLLQTKSSAKVLDVTATPMALGVSDAALQINDFNNLTHYIKRLGDVVEKLPYSSSNTNNNNNNIDNKKPKKSNLNWFRINGEGNIEQHIDDALDALPAHTSIFHRFPDIPGAEALTTAAKSH